MHSSLALIAFMAAGSAVAKIIEIDVGKGGLVYSPDTVTADVGDTLEFHFFASFHTAVQGDFSTPCQRGSLESTGFNSGPINNKADGTVRLPFLSIL
jgi:plastocyanin